MIFEDRAQAGRELARRLSAWKGSDVVVLGLARGGLPVAEPVARALGAPLEVVVVRKLSAPQRPELAIGALGEAGVRLLSEDVIAQTGTSSSALAASERAERAELERRAALYRSGRGAPNLSGRTALVIDDGLATGATARAACRVARAWGAQHVVLAVPVAPRGLAAEMTPDADDVVVLEEPRDFYAVGEHYRDFSQTTDEEVLACLRRARVPTERPPRT